MGNRIAEGLAALTASSKEIASDILILEFRIVNAFLIGDPNAKSGEWALVDTGLENSGEFIIKEAEKRFGTGSRPKAILLTHGHFDHVGSVKQLSEHWDVPVYVHPMEMPYVTGKKDYPAGDPVTDEGMVAKMSPTFPHTRIDVSFRTVELPKDGSVPGMPGWCWVHTPGHTEGHVSFFRERDGSLIAGDALATVKQESLLSVITQKEQISGPPKYMTTDWKKAKESVCVLNDLDPCMIIPSHGQPMKGEEAREHLKYLAENFDEVAKPEQGRFV
jgi:glyoxylase-like metal-dependent hydrolase (beta-lactamase superfamily II)